MASVIDYQERYAAREARAAERDALIDQIELLQSRLGEQPKSIHDAVFAFRAMFKMCPFPAWVKNSDGYMLAKNPAYTEIYGSATSDERYIGLLDSDVWPEETAARYDANDREALSEGSMVRFEKIENEVTGRPEALEVAKWAWVLDNGDKLVVGVVTGNIPQPSCARYER